MQTGNGSSGGKTPISGTPAQAATAPAAGVAFQPLVIPGTAEQGPEFSEESEEGPDNLEDTRPQADSPGLLRPVLDLSHIDERNRPFLVWTESQGATHYLLQEDDNPAFSKPREYRVRADETRWSPPMLWRRSGRLFYRVRALHDHAAGPWSEVLSLRIGAH
jgi:hypothetical protein